MGAILALGLAVAGSATAQTQGRKDGTLVEVDIAATTDIAPTSRIYAQIVTNPPAAVLAPIDAVMTLEDLKIGTFVEKGTLIATQQTDDLRLKLQQQRLNLEMTGQRLAQLDDQIRKEKTILALLSRQAVLLEDRTKRLAQLMNNQVIKRDQFEAVEIQLLTARRQSAESQGRIMKLEADQALEQIKRRQTEADIADIKADLAAADIRAVVAGQLIELPAARQKFTREGEVLARILSPEDYEIEADIPIGLLAFLRTRIKVTGIDADGQPVQSVFRAELPEENQKTATRPVRLEIASGLTPAMRADGARVQLDIPSSLSRTALTVPVDAIISDQDQTLVYVAEDGTASRREVRLGATLRDRVEITAGLAAGEAVIIKGNENLRDGAKIKIVGQ